MVSNRHQSGFTLVEIIIGIVVISLSFSVITTLVLPATEKSADQVQQIKAAELGQSLLTEILGRAYDENSDQAGGAYRCNDAGRDACKVSASLGSDGESRSNYDDVDDFNELKNVDGQSILDAQGNNLGDYYFGFTLDVDVIYDGNFDGVSDNNQLAKLITVSVTTPSGEVIQFSGYRANF